MTVRTYDLVPHDVQAALNEFSEEFMVAYAQLEEPALVALGAQRSTQAAKVTFPFPIYAPQFRAFTGEMWYRSLAEKSIELIPGTFQDGVKLLARLIESIDWMGWGEQPAAMAMNARTHMAELIAAALDAGTSVVTPWDGLAFFHAAHYINPGKKSAGTFANYTTGRALSADNIKLAKAEMRAIPAPNGKPGGRKLTHVLVPTALEGTLDEIVHNTFVVASGTVGPVENLLKNSFEPMSSAFLTDLDDWYAISVPDRTSIPWVSIEKGSPEEILQDKTDALYKNSLEIAYAVLMERVVGLGDPHTMIRYRGT
jgi:phage major head subunit gpT-like protein